MVPNPEFLARKLSFRSRRFHRYVAVLAASALVAQCMLFAACGGAGNHPPRRASVESVRTAIETAKTQPEMEKARDLLVSATQVNVPFSTAVPDNKGLPQDLIDVAAAAQLEQPASERKTIGEWYDLIRDGMDPQAKLPGTREFFVAALNASLPDAYAAPNQSAMNAVMVLLTSPPGTGSGLAPTITVNTVLSPMQVLLLARYYASQVGARYSCSLCWAQYAFESAACIIASALCTGTTAGWLAPLCVAAGVVCVGLAGTHLAMCLQDCHQQS